MSGNIFDAGRLVTAEQVARYLGIRISPSGRAYCPFHGGGTERHPAMALYAHSYYCFACNVGGDCVDLVARYRNVRPLEAAKILNDEFRLGLDGSPISQEEKQKWAEEKKAKEHRKQMLKRAYSTLCWATLRMQSEEPENDKEMSGVLRRLLKLSDRIEYLSCYYIENGDLPDGWETVVAKLNAIRKLDGDTTGD